ncbi:hypothetical protein DH2020_000117 [Rehmannia glutinosa]|uniref:Uncharacterized protein n=1 Tax=Rehmannia glutinosa TaxID=99300 RepID=A0ABR0XW04_REHGL
MFDLNLSIDCSDNFEGQSPATSFSSAVNGEGEFSSSNDGACSPRASPVSGGDAPSHSTADCGKQVYLERHDRAAIKFRGVDADINFSLSDYDDMKQMMNLSKDEFVHILRRQSNGFSRGSSKYRGVTLHKCGHWEARTGQFLGKNEAVTNFESSICNGGEMVPETSNEGSQHDLDLNLGMPKSPPKETANSCSLQFHRNIQNARTLKFIVVFYRFSASGILKIDFLRFLQLNMENSGMKCISNPPLEGLPVTSEHPILWTAVNPKFVPNYEERASEQRMASVSPQVVANWARQMHGQFRATLNGTSSNAKIIDSHQRLPPLRFLPFHSCYSSYPNTSLTLRNISLGYGHLLNLLSHLLKFGKYV